MNNASVIRRLPTSRDVGTVWIPVRNSVVEIAKAQGGKVRVTIEMEVEHADLLENMSAIENAIVEQEMERARAAGERIVEPTVKWSRKEMGGFFLGLQCEDYAERLKEMERALGPIPDAKDAAAVKAYATKVAAWRSKSLKRG